MPQGHEGTEDGVGDDAARLTPLGSPRLLGLGIIRGHLLGVTVIGAMAIEGLWLLGVMVWRDTAIWGHGYWGHSYWGHS